MQERREKAKDKSKKGELSAEAILKLKEKFARKKQRRLERKAGITPEPDSTTNNNNKKAKKVKDHSNVDTSEPAKPLSKKAEWKRQRTQTSQLVGLFQAGALQNVNFEQAMAEVNADLQKKTQKMEKQALKRAREQEAIDSVVKGVSQDPSFSLVTKKKKKKSKQF